MLSFLQSCVQLGSSHNMYKANKLTGFPSQAKHTDISGSALAGQHLSLLSFIHNDTHIDFCQEWAIKANLQKLWETNNKK